MKPAIPPAVLMQHSAFLGKTGSGKTSTAKLAVEQILRENPNARVCVLDALKSDWWGMTSSADGKKAGLPFYVIGGPRGHVPLHSSAGKAIGEVVGNGSLPLSIIDMANFEAGELQKFFNDFTPALMKHMRGVVYLVLEEAHEFAPKERSGIGAETMAIYHAKKLATAGRSKGIRLMVVTQRTQALHNALLGSCDTMIAHRLTAPADQEPVLKWLKANMKKDELERVASSLSSLKTGSAWICSGEAQVAEFHQFPKIKTFDNSATPTDDASDLEVKTATVDQDKLRAIIGAAVKTAEDNDPRILRATIARLERQIATASPIIPPLNADEQQKIHDGGFAAGVVETTKAYQAKLSALKGLSDKFGGLIEEAAGAQLTLIPLKMPPSYGRQLQSAIKSIAPKSSLATGGGSPSFSTAELPKGERACLIAVAQHPNGCTRAQLTVLTGYKRSTRDAYLQRLKERDAIEQAGDRITATDIGIATLGGDYDPLPTGEALQQHVMRTLPDGEAKCLGVLLAAYPSPASRDQISEETGYKRSTRDAYLQRLATRELIETTPGNAIASRNLF